MLRYFTHLVSSVQSRWEGQLKSPARIIGTIDDFLLHAVILELFLISSMFCSRPKAFSSFFPENSEDSGKDTHHVEIVDVHPLGFDLWT